MQQRMWPRTHPETRKGGQLFEAVKMSDFGTESLCHPPVDHHPSHGYLREEDRLKGPQNHSTVNALSFCRKQFFPAGIQFKPDFVPCWPSHLSQATSMLVHVVVCCRSMNQCSMLKMGILT